jgi:hypothetical protein
MSTVEKITRIPIKDAFQYEDRDFTPWLLDNIDVIGDAVGLELIGAEKEQSTGNFSVDLKAETSDGRVVVIENQYGKSDHDHLGKVITYLSSFGAEVAIWIVETPKQEHINAITWLNEGENNCDFYLLKVEAIRIGDSAPAPLLTEIVGPSIESKEIGKKRKDDTENEKLRSKFWEQLLAKTKEIGVPHFTSPSFSGKDAWVGVSAGKPGLSYVYWVNQQSCRIELRIDRGKDLDDQNLEILRTLETNKQEIESAFGGELNWADMEGYRVCSIRKEIEGGYKNANLEWDQQIAGLSIDMQKLIQATTKYVRALKI